MTNTRRALIIGVGVIIIILVGTADNSYPRGEGYPTGRYVQLERYDTIEYARLPSPESNPGWVQFLQNNDDGILLIVVVVMFCVISTWDSNKRLTET